MLNACVPGNPYECGTLNVAFTFIKTCYRPSPNINIHTLFDWENVCYHRNSSMKNILKWKTIKFISKF